MSKRAWWVVLVVNVLLWLPSAAWAQRPRAVNIDSVPQGAIVRLDSEASAPIGTTPMRRVRIPQGAHTLYFTHDGFIPGSISINVIRARETFTGTLVQGGSIYVAADIDGAQIFIDGTPVGSTPGRVNNVQPGQHIISIRQTGMQTFQETVTVGAGAVATVNATLRPPPPQAPPTGVVRVIVTNPNGPTPNDLQVTFDGVPMSGAPATNDQAQPGTHIVQITANGFRTVRREVTVVAGQTFALAVDLDAIQTAPTGGTVRVITVTAGAQAYLDGELLTAANGAPFVRENVPAGTHSLRVTAPNRQPTTREITVTAGQATVLEIPDLTAVAQVGRMLVRSSTPNVSVFIDGRNVGPSPYTRDDMPAGNYNITLRAQGFDDRNETCTVSTSQPCDVNFPLTRTMGHAALHVELSRPVGGATLLIDGNSIGEVGAGRDVPNVTAESHEIRVRAEGYADYVESVTFQENEQHRTLVSLRRSRRGPSGAELATRRSAISTWGASPLARRDLAGDLFLAYGSYPVEVRGTTGLMDYGAGGADAGFAIRSMGVLWEIELRGRVGYRAAGGLLAVGAEIAPFAGLGFAGQMNYGVRGYAVASLHSLGPSDDEADSNNDDPNERADRPGSFAFSLRFGFEAMNDGLAGSIQRYSGAATTTFAACDPQTTGPAPSANPCNITPRTDSGGNTVVQTGAQGVVRPLAGVAIEIGLSRHANLFLSAERVLGDQSPAQQHRAYYEQFWNWIGGQGHNDSFTYVRAGLTYKF